MQEPVGEDTGEGLASQYHDLKSLCIWVLCSFQWKRRFVSAVPPQCLLCFSARISYLVWRVSM